MRPTAHEDQDMMGGGGSGALSHEVACMEIWGGNEGVDRAVRTPGLDVWVHARPFGGASAGGDVHYVSLCAAGKIARFAVADVSGHGNEVSGASAALRGLMRRNINTLDQSAFARSLNSAFQMSGTAADGHFATALLASYYAPSGHLVLVNAGHPRPLLYRATARRWVAIGGEDERADGLARTRVLKSSEGEEAEGLPGNLPLGIIDPTSYVQVAVPLDHGDVVVMVTDGVVESRSAEGAELGEAGLVAALSRLDASRPGALMAGLLREVEAHTGGAALGDDVTAVVMHHHARARRYTLAERVATLARWAGL